MIDVLGMVAERRQVLAAEQAARRETTAHAAPRRRRSSRYPGELGERQAAGSAQVLEHLEAEDKLEGGVRERQLVDALGSDATPREAARAVNSTASG